MKRFLLLLVCLTLLFSHSGCNEPVAAALNPSCSAPSCSDPLWTSTDVSRVLDDLRSIRQQEKLLKEIKDQTASTNAAIASLREQQAEWIAQVQQATSSTNSAVSSVSSSLDDLRTDIDGVEQRLDNPPDPVSAPAISHSPPASSASPCVKIGGIDYDVAQFIADHYVNPWYWEGAQTIDGLTKHLREHGVEGFENLSFPIQQKLHAAVHEKEIAARQAPVSSGIEMGATGNLQLFGDVQPQNNPPDSGLAVIPPAPPEPEVQRTVPAPTRSRTVTITQTSPTSSSVSTRSRTVSCPGGVCNAPRVSYQWQSRRERRVKR